MNLPDAQAGRAGVVASILSFNSCRALRETIARVLGQSVAPDAVIVVDNASTDDTGDYLATLAPPVVVIRLDENVGVGRGHHVGWEAALARPGCAFVWVLEHDTWPEPACLERQLHAARSLLAAGEPVGSVNAWLERDEAEAVRPLRPRPDTDGPIPANRLTFNATLLPRAAIERAGYPREDFFVGHEDWEYARRLKDAGLALYRVPAALALHPTKGDRRHGSPPSIARAYYSARNGLYLERFVERRRGATLRGVLQALGSATAMLVARGGARQRRLARAGARLTASFDGLTSRLGPRSYWFLRPRP